jgi:pimeloyl-ACP methyl ester carboxylesterase
MGVSPVRIAAASSIFCWHRRSRFAIAHGRDAHATKCRIIIGHMLASLLMLALIMLLVGVLLVGLTLLLMALTLLRPPRMTDGKASAVLRRISPGDLGMTFEETRFDVRDARTGRVLPIAAWWVPHPTARGRCVVLVHGYADGKVGAIAWAPMWQALGYHVLAIDLRAHGYSGGTFTTAGYFERHDLNQVLDQLLAERPDETRQLVLFGVSLGAAVALGTALLRDDIDALVLECPYADYLHGVKAHAAVMRTPLPSLTRVAYRLAERLCGARFDEVRPVEMLARVAVPTMVIEADADPFVPPGDRDAIERVMCERAERGLMSVYWNVSEAAHVMGIVADADEYARRIGAFLSTTGLRGAGKVSYAESAKSAENAEETAL